MAPGIINDPTSSTLHSDDVNTDNQLLYDNQYLSFLLADDPPQTGPQLMKSTWEKWGKNFDECAKKYLRRWAMQQGWRSARDRETYLKGIDSVDTNFSGLLIDATVSGKNLAKRWGVDVRPGTFVSGTFAGGKIRIAKELWTTGGWDEVPNMNGQTYVENVVIHEAGNAFSELLTGSQYSFGKLNVGDPDSGKQIQSCTFAMPPKK